MTFVTHRTLLCAVLGSFPLWIGAASPLFADVTIRYQTNIKTGPGVPPQAKEQIQKQAAFGQSVLRMKDGKGWSQTGGWTSIIDFTTQQMTLLDAEHHTFSSLPVSDLPDKMAAVMPKMPDEAKKAMANLKTSVDFKKTENTDTVLGFQAEERVMTLIIGIPLPGGASQSGGAQSGMAMKMVMRMWTAKPEEALHSQAIRELMGYRLWSNYFMNPERMLEKTMANMPGISDALKPMMDDLSKNNAVILRTRMSMYMTLPAEVRKKMAEQDPSTVAMTDDAPMFEMNQEAAELSSESVEASLFQVPADYHAIAADELLKTMMQSQLAGMGVPAKP